VESNMDLDHKSTLATSRRSFLAASRLALGAGLALTLGIAGAASPAKAQFGNGWNGGDKGSNGGHKGWSSGHKGWSGGDKGWSEGPSCFLPGTQIDTAEGRCNIEELKIGDRILTASGEVKRIKWVGRQEVKPAVDTAPVKIARFAIDGKAPHADLYVSPSHAIFISGMLIPVGHLVNGKTIVADTKPEMQTITYYHIELDAHDVIVAEGLAVESFGGNDRGKFDNADEYVALYGSLGEPLAPCAPVAAYLGGRQELASHIRSALAPIYDFRRPIDKVRDRLADRAEFAFAA
jgi:hypothetical protein